MIENQILICRIIYAKLEEILMNIKKKDITFWAAILICSLFYNVTAIKTNIFTEYKHQWCLYYYVSSHYVPVVMREWIDNIASNYIPWNRWYDTRARSYKRFKNYCFFTRDDVAIIRKEKRCADVLLYSFAIWIYLHVKSSL